MVAGIDRYFQIARCYRDEDLRGDRQPEFTQLDLEMSFVDEASVMAFVEAMAIEVSAATTPDRPLLSVPFPVLTFEDAIERYGTDKPDIRFAMELVDLAPALSGPDGQGASGFVVFDSALAAGGRVKAIVAPGMAGITRREIDELTERAKRFGAKGLAYLALESDGTVKSPIAKFLSEETQRAIIERAGASAGDLILIVADTHDVTADVLGRLRVELGGRLDLADPEVLAYVWVHRFPMYHWDTEGERWDATHNPFSGVLPEDEALLTTATGDPTYPSRDDPAGRARALQYDLALNGWELGGGSIRIHRRELLETSFRLQGQTHRGDAGEVRRRPGRLRVRRPATRRHRARHRSLGDDLRRPDEHPRGHGLPEDPVRHGSDARGAVRPGARAVRGAWPALRRVARAAVLTGAA